MSGSGIADASRAWVALFWAGVVALCLSLVVGLGSAWSSQGRIPFGSMGYLQSIRTLKRTGHVDAAVRELEGDQRINVPDVRSSLMLSKLFAEQGRPGSLEALEFASEYSFDPTIQIKLAVALVDAKRTDEARAALERALVVGHDDVDVLVAAGQGYAQIGSPDRARALLRRALALDPGARAAQRALLDLEARRGGP